MARAHLATETQYWTSRGFAVVDDNYCGSSGFGRAYRARLNGMWGVVDTQDCIDAARHLAAQGLADRARLAIRGGSAGGYTTLCALVFHDDFAVGASYFGVADCEALVTDTHKFESRYLDGLIGPYPQARELYRRRSPIHYADRLVPGDSVSGTRRPCGAATASRKDGRRAACQRSAVRLPRL